MINAKNVRNFWICLDQTFQGLGMGKLFPVRESLESDIPAGDRNTAKPLLQCRLEPRTVETEALAVRQRMQLD